MVTSVMYITGAPICRSESPVSRKDTAQGTGSRNRRMWRTTTTRKL